MSILRGPNFLMAPGPTRVPERVLQAMHRPAVEINAPDFVALSRSCIDGLKPVFRSSGEVFLYAANGHGAWEAVLANTLSPGDRVLVADTGVFSHLWGEMAQALGAEVVHAAGEPRRGISPEAVEARLREDRGERIKAVLAVHTETANGITSDLHAVREAIDAASHPALFMADVVASLGCAAVRVDDWGIDVALGAAQKGLMSPPGLSFSAVGPRALAASERARTPRVYWDWKRRLGEEGYTWFSGTPPVHLLFALREAMDMLREEGLDAAFARHRRLADAVRAAVDAWGGSGEVEINALVPAERSNSVTSVIVHAAGGADAVFRFCRDRLNVSLGIGLGEPRKHTFRIAHMGDVNEASVLGALAAVETAFRSCDVPHAPGGVDAAIASLARHHRHDRPPGPAPACPPRCCDSPAAGAGRHDRLPGPAPA